MSPEQVRGERLGPESDVFSLGSVLAYAATGHGPFDSATAPAIIYRIATEPPDLGPLSGPLRGVISECLAKNPADRPTLDRLPILLSDVPGQFAPGEFAPGRHPTVPPAPRTPPPDATLPPAQSIGGQRIPGFPATPERAARPFAPGTGGISGNSRRFPIRRVAALGGGLAAVLAIALGVYFSTHGGTGTNGGAGGQACRPGTTASTQHASRQPNTSSAPPSTSAPPATTSAPPATTSAPPATTSAPPASTSPAFPRVRARPSATRSSDTPLSVKD